MSVLGHGQKAVFFNLPVIPRKTLPPSLHLSNKNTPFHQRNEAWLQLLLRIPVNFKIDLGYELGQKETDRNRTGDHPDLNKISQSQIVFSKRKITHGTICLASWHKRDKAWNIKQNHRHFLETSTKHGTHTDGKCC